MTIRHEVWKIGAKPEPLAAASLVSESELEEMIVAEPPINGCLLDAKFKRPSAASSIC
jgi:hypothetical protein